MWEALRPSAERGRRFMVCERGIPARSGNKLSVNFYIVGSKVTEEIKALEQPGNGIVVKGFVSEEELSELYRTCRLVVVPLRYGAGVKGKVVEAIYNGAPIVTTSVGSEGIPGRRGCAFSQRISRRPSPIRWLKRTATQKSSESWQKRLRAISEITSASTRPGR